MKVVFKNFLCIALFLLSINQVHASSVNSSLYIIGDSLQTVNAGKMPYFTFNKTNSFSQKNAIIELNVGDSLNLWIHNTDSIDHIFDIKGVVGINRIVPSGDSVNIIHQFNTAGLYIYYDSLNFPVYSYLGLAGSIVVKDNNHSSFFWNTKEHQSSWNESLATGGSVLWNDYQPDFFTINGLSHPDIITDPQINIVGNVGDTILVYIANTGRGMRSIHFHGYHAEIKYSSKYPSHIGRSKDTFPIHSMETVVLQIVPDKPGEYPVHEHNLIAVTGNSFYPNGMFSITNIQP
tara:strand:+ start:1919 stop:2791 length:873 start_codon:yes stop_codon:yes gene_type:complete